MPTIETPTEKWAGQIREVTLGAGSRTPVVIGGESTLPFLHFEGATPNPPVVAIDVEDRPPERWSPALTAAWGDVIQQGTAAWAKKAVEYGADMIALTLRSADPEGGNTGPDEAVDTVKQVLGAVDVPLIVYGPGVAEKDNEVLVAVADATAGEQLALGLCEEKNYRTIVATCLANGHIPIAFSPMDVNLAKQMNILITDMGLPADRILMDSTTGALGYGLEYAYSVMERLRLAALQGDSMTNMPLILNPGREAWCVKEAMASEGVPAEWGDIEERGITWETITALTLIQAGADILVMRHPRAVELIKGAINGLMASN